MTGRESPAAIDTERLLAVIADVAREAHPGAQPQVTLDASLEKDLRLDSLARVELVLRVEQSFATELPEHALASGETPRDLLRFLLSGVEHAPTTAETVPTAVEGGAVRPPEHAVTLTQALEYHVERQPERLTAHLYVQEEGRPITYRMLWDRALGYCARLVEAGLRPGNTVAIMLPTCEEYLYCLYGVMLAGGIPVPLYPPARLSTIEDHMKRHVGILRNANANVLVTVPQAKGLAHLLRASVESLRAVLYPADLEGAAKGVEPWRGRAGDIAFLQYTSGSTGDPKGVILTHANVLANVRAAAAALGATHDDVFVGWLPLYHDMGLVGGCFATMYCGFPTVLMSPLAFLSRPARWLQTMDRHRGTISGGPNFSYELCMRRIREEELEGIDLSSWRFAFNGAEPVSPQTLAGFSARFARNGFAIRAMSPVYGLAECTVGLAVTPPLQPWRVATIDREVFASTREAVPSRPDDPSPLAVVGCGLVFDGHDVRVVDAAGLELADRHEGRLQFRGPSATSGYYRNPRATQQLFDGTWLNTGDHAYLDDGQLFVTGREKDMIIRGGRNISPYELEHAVGEHAGIRRGCVAVFGSPDPRTGTERVVVLAETREQVGEPEQLKRAITELAVDLIGGPVDEIVLAPPGTVPKTSSGKIRRAAARELYESGSVDTRQRAVWLQLLGLALAGAAPQLRRWRQAIYGLLFALRAYLVFATLLPIALAAALLAPGRVCWNTGRRLAGWFLRWSRIPLMVTGLEKLPTTDPVVLASNHTSYLDVVVLLSLLEYRGYRFVGKRELATSFLMRRLAVGFGALFVERDDLTRSTEQVDDLAAAIRAGHSLIVFPEGTFARRAGLMPFRTGAFQAALQAGVPVVPITLRGLRSVLRDGTWYVRSAPASATFGAPITHSGRDWAAAVKLRNEVRTAILRHCGEPDLAMTAPPPLSDR